MLLGSCGSLVQVEAKLEIMKWVSLQGSGIPEKYRAHHVHM